jgi:hypothetical protein
MNNKKNSVQIFLDAANFFLIIVCIIFGIVNKNITATLGWGVAFLWFMDHIVYTYLVNQ